MPVAAGDAAAGPSGKGVVVVIPDDGKLTLLPH